MNVARVPVDGDFARACSLADELQAEVGRLFVLTGGDAATEDDRRVAELVRRTVDHVGQAAADLHLAQAGTYWARRGGAS